MTPQTKKQRAPRKVLTAKLYRAIVADFQCPSCEVRINNPDHGGSFNEEEDKGTLVICHNCGQELRIPMQQGAWW